MTCAGGGKDACRVRRHHRAASLPRLVARDLQRYLDHMAGFGGGGEGLRKRVSAMLAGPMRAALLHRVSHFLHANHRYCMAAFLEGANRFLHRIRITSASCVEGGLVVPHTGGVVFHGTAGGDLTMYAGAICGSQPSLVHEPLSGSPRLGRGVTLGTKAVVLGALAVGDDTLIGFATGTYIDLPASSLVVSRSMSVRIREEPRTSPGDAVGSGGPP